MKKLILSLVFTLSLFACSNEPEKRESVDLDSEMWQTDSIVSLNQSLKTLKEENNKLKASFQERDDSIKFLLDSIALLNEKPIMSEKQFIELYKYGRIVKYYAICKKNPSQYKYFKGWVIRAIEE